jgi:hypothetical protein
MEIKTMKINDTAYRQVARWLNENWDKEVIKADSFSDIYKKTNSICNNFYNYLRDCRNKRYFCKRLKIVDKTNLKEKI